MCHPNSVLCFLHLVPVPSLQFITQYLYFLISAFTQPLPPPHQFYPLPNSFNKSNLCFSLFQVSGTYQIFHSGFFFKNGYLFFPLCRIPPTISTAGCLDYLFLQKGSQMCWWWWAWSLLGSFFLCAPACKRD